MPLGLPSCVPKTNPNAFRCKRLSRVSRNTWSRNYYGVYYILNAGRSVDGFIRVYDVRKAGIVTDRVGQSITHLRLSNDKNCFLASTLDSSLRLLDKESGELLAEYKASEYKNEEFKLISTLSYTDAYVIAGSENGRILMWDLVEADVVRTLNGHTNAVTCVEYHSDRHIMVSGSLDGSVKVWI